MEDGSKRLVYFGTKNEIHAYKNHQKLYEKYVLWKTLCMNFKKFAPK